ncbi:stress response protein NST1 [Senna tora]|uniref:Stress response protein NST1 n=1 Tax=Senna tora TaxID=362788 RepID=A0A834W5E1_9FABA|nr:stress response protein NST1 [Senna tora]
MKSRSGKNEERSEKFNKSESVNKSKKNMMRKKNMTRLGGGGLSLEAFANAKSKDNHYNPALIKKQREFYKNAKNVKKFKKLLKRENPQNDLSSAQRRIQNENGSEEGQGMSKKRPKKDSALSLEELYKKKHEEKEKERVEREAAIKAKKEEVEEAEARRKAMREKMLKKTRKGQPVMKYRIEHLLETIQASTKN